MIDLMRHGWMELVAGAFVIALWMLRAVRRRTPLHVAR